MVKRGGKFNMSAVLKLSFYLSIQVLRIDWGLEGDCVDLSRKYGKTRRIFRLIIIWHGKGYAIPCTRTYFDPFCLRLVLWMFKYPWINLCRKCNLKVQILNFRVITIYLSSILLQLCSITRDMWHTATIITFIFIWTNIYFQYLHIQNDLGTGYPA
jgi:hypothetical protein